MLRQIDKKKRLSIYILLLFLLSTINNLSLINSEYLNLKIKRVYVNGLDEERNFKISTDLNKLIFENIFFMDEKIFTKILKKNNLIHSFNVKKIYPDSIEINIKKTEFLGITYNKEEKFFIGSNGKLIKFESNNQNIPIVDGEFKIKNFISFKKIIDESKLDFQEISKIHFFPSGRWDIKLKNEILIKLPDHNLLEALNLGIKILDIEKFKKNSVIDLRITNHVITKK